MIELFARRLIDYNGPASSIATATAMRNHPASQLASGPGLSPALQQFGYKLKSSQMGKAHWNIVCVVLSILIWVHVLHRKLLNKHKHKQISQNIANTISAYIYNYLEPPGLNSSTWFSVNTLSPNTKPFQGDVPHLISGMDIQGHHGTDSDTVQLGHLSSQDCAQDLEPSQKGWEEYRTSKETDG